MMTFFFFFLNFMSPGEQFLLVDLTSSFIDKLKDLKKLKDIIDTVRIIGYNLNLSETLSTKSIY